MFEQAVAGLLAMGNLDFGADWGNSAVNNYKNGHYILGTMQLVNGMGEAAIDLVAAYFGASLVGATTSAIGTAITEKSITAGYIDFDIKLNGYLSNGKSKLSNAYNGIKSKFINTFKTGKKTNRGLSVIGPRNNYREFAKSIGANYLNVKDEEWTKEKNLKYLKGVVSRKDDVIFSGDYDPSKLDPNSVLAWEINYLEAHGYKYTENNIWSIK